MKTKDQIQEEALQAIGGKRRSGIEISMGVGKTLTGIKHMGKFYNEFASYLVVAPTKKIYKSWSDDVEEFGYEHLSSHINFSTYRSLHKLNPQDYDVVYLDECHSLKEGHIPFLKGFLAKGGTIVGLTGTYPVYKNTEKGKMCGYFCPKVYEYKTDDAVGDNILNDYKIFVHKLYLNGVPTIPVNTKDGNTFLTSEVKSYAYWSQRVLSASSSKESQICRVQRMKALQGFNGKTEYAKKLMRRQTEKVIVFANTKEQANEICENRVHSGVPNKKADEVLQQFKDGSITQLSAVDQLSEGVTIPQLKVGIIMHSYANNRKAAQKIGRILRLNPDETGEVHISCYVNSIDADWVKSALQHLNQDKIEWIDPII